MKMPFGSRRPRLGDLDPDLDEFDDDESFAHFGDGTGGGGEQRVGYAEDRPHPRPEPRERPAPFDDEWTGYDSEDDLDPAPPPVRRSGLRRRAEMPGEGDVSADEFVDQMERLRSEASAEQRTAWAYLGVLTGVFAFLVVFGYGCSDQTGNEVATGEASEVLASGEPSRLVFRVDGDIITLEGSVPDSATVERLVNVAQGTYGAQNVIDALVIDSASTLEAGTIRTVGSAMVDDARPQALHDAIGADFGLANRGFEVGFVEVMLDPVVAQVAVQEDRVALSGALPDQQSVDDLVAAAGEIWGPANVDPTGLSIGQTTWSGGRVSLTGTALSNDTRPTDFTTSLSERLGVSVATDTAGLVVEDITALLVEVQQQIRDLVTDNPIQFEPLSAEIQAESDDVLVQLATLLDQAPTAEFEVVGHTDSVGDDQENLLLSQERASAVVDRLAELGVEPARMTSRGEGENSPVADNDTDEGKALNRRIEFVFVGLAELVDGDAVVGDSTTTTEG